MKTLAACLILATACCGSDPARGAEPAALPGSGGKTRSFTFHYRFRVKGLNASNNVKDNLIRAWLPCPASSDFQQILRLPATTPGEISVHQEARYGNPTLFFQAHVPATGEFIVDVPYKVVRREVRGSLGYPECLDHTRRDLFLRANKLIPTTGKPLKLLAGLELRKDKFELARQLYDFVDDHVTYKKDGAGWGRGDTNWVCESRYGNCTDFHSLFMSLARSQGLPTRFEIGFSLPSDKSEGLIAGYHCWAWFYLDGRGWIPVDISEADKHPELKDYYFGNLTADRVAFSVGRDLELVPKSAQPSLNYFIYPHIEVRDVALPPENIELQMSFKDS